MHKTLFRNPSLCVSVGLLGMLCFATSGFASHPLISDDTGTMGTGNAQLELNGEYDHDKEDGVTTKTTEGSAHLTYGLNESIDLVGSFPYQYAKTEEAGANTTEDGIADISFEVKWRFYERGDFSLALKPGFSLPTGDDDKGLGNGKSTHSLFFLASNETDLLAFHLNLGYTRNRNTGADEKDIWHASLASSLALTERLVGVANIGIESNPDKLTDTDPAFLLAGLVYTLSDEFDLDCGVKYGLNDPETDYSILTGITWKF